MITDPWEQAVDNPVLLVRNLRRHVLCGLKGRKLRLSISPRTNSHFLVSCSCCEYSNYLTLKGVQR